MKKSNVYFDLEKYEKKQKIKRFEKPIAHFITSTRNIGKTWAGWIVAEKESLSVNNKLVYLRNSDKNLIGIRGEFNAKFKNKFYMSKMHIYNMVFDKSKERYITNDLIGYVASISTYGQNKSMEYKNVNFIFYDEFNSKELITDIYWKFINLITSFIRQNPNVYILALANRDNENNPYSVTLGMDDYEIQEEDITFKVNDRNDIAIYWTELGTNWINKVNNRDTLFYELAKYDSSSLKYLEGEYMIKKPKQVLNSRKIIPTFKAKHGFYFQQGLYYFGTFIKNDIETFAIVLSSNYNLKEDITIYSFDILSDYIANSKIIMDSTKNELKNMYINLIKNKNMYFDSFNLKRVFDLMIR